MNNLLEEPIIRNAVAVQRSLDIKSTNDASRIIKVKKWPQMNKNEREACVRHLVCQAVSKHELRDCLEDLGCEHASIYWDDISPEPKVKTIVQTISRASGRLISKNGALVIITTGTTLY